MKSDRTLRRWYLHINKKFFLGELPANVIVRWALPGEEKDVACTERLYSDKRYCFEILLNRDKVKSNSIKLSCLAHEMIHVATKYRDEHGPAFESWRVLLGERGLFKKGALLKGVSLF